MSEQALIAELIAMKPYTKDIQPTLYTIKATIGSDTHIIPDETLCTIGRSRHRNTIAIPLLETVSRKHASIKLVIEPDDVHLVLHDAGSSNGTFVNGKRIECPHTLRNRDEIGLGNPEGMLCFLFSDGTTVKQIHEGLIYVPESMTFMLNGQPLSLPRAQFRLLLHLYKNEQHVCTRASCEEAILGEEYAHGPYNGLDEAISSLRKALGQRATDPKETQFIRTRHKIGYLLVRNPERKNLQ